jgi:hypothetical protein
MMARGKTLNLLLLFCVFLPVVDDAPDFDLEDLDDLDDLRMEGGGDEVIGMVVVDVRLVRGGRTAIAVIQTGD